MASAAQRAALKKDPTGKKHQKEALGNAERENASIDPILATADAWLSDHREAIIVLPGTNRAVKIQSLDPGEQFFVYDDPLAALAADAGVDIEDEDERKAFVSNLSIQERYAITESRLANYRRLIIRSVISLRLRMYQQHMCEPGELSVWKLSDLDVLFLHKEVSRLSGWTAAATEFQDVQADTEERKSED